MQRDVFARGYRDDCVVAMPSQTYAMQGQTLLAGAGMRFRVIRLPSGATKKGCAYGLQGECRRIDEAVRRLEAAGIRHGEILGV